MPTEAKQEQTFVVAGAPAATTPAAEWGDTAKRYRLPSGNVARLVRPALMVLAARGLIPNPYLVAIRKLLAGRDLTKTDAERWDVFAENVEAFLGVAQLAMQEPRLILDGQPGPGQIGPQALSDRDLLWLYYDFTEGGAVDVASFLVEG